MKWDDRLRQWMGRRVERSRFQQMALGVLSFLESTVLPIPLEVVLLPYMVSHRKRVWIAAASVTKYG